MKEPYRFKVSAQAVEDGIRLGIKGNVEEKIAEMAHFSGNLTYPGANRRYEGYAFRIENGVVVAVMPYDRKLNDQAWAEKKARKRRRKESSPENGEG